MTKEQTEMMAEIKRLQAENQRLQEQRDKARRITLKVSDKGGLSVYGLGRFPVTLYREQWEALLARADEVKAFIKANDDKLKTKQAA